MMYIKSAKGEPAKAVSLMRKVIDRYIVLPRAVIFFRLNPTI